VAPPDAVLGQFGGRAVQLLAEGNKVSVQVECGGVAVFNRSIIPASDGQFWLAPILSASNGTTVAVAIKGTVDSNQIAFELTKLGPNGVTSAQFVVKRDEPVEWLGTACLTS
jgi:hypothetical protein